VSLRYFGKIMFKSQKHPDLLIYIIVHNMQAISLIAVCGWLMFHGFGHFVIRNIDLSFFKILGHIFLSFYV